MKFGMGIGRGLDFSHIKDLAIDAEKLGYDSLWVADAVLPHPWVAHFDGQGGFFDAATLLGAVSSVTTMAKIGVSVFVVPLWHPLRPSHIICSLDHASNGRLIVGMGVGALHIEYEALNVPYTRRGDLLDETLAILKLIWTQDRVNYTGKLFRLQDISILPKPLQQPHPPLWFGGAARHPRSRRRIAQYSDGWVPVNPTVESFALNEGKRIRELAGGFGRTPSDIQFAGCFFTYLSHDTTAVRDGVNLIRPWYERRRAEDSGSIDGPRPDQSVDALIREKTLVGRPRDIVQRIEEYVKAGVTHLYFSFVPHSKTKEQMQVCAREVLPSFR